MLVETLNRRRLRDYPVEMNDSLWYWPILTPCPFYLMISLNSHLLDTGYRSFCISHLFASSSSFGRAAMGVPWQEGSGTTPLSFGRNWWSSLEKNYFEWWPSLQRMWNVTWERLHLWSTRLSTRERSKPNKTVYMLFAYVVFLYIRIRISRPSLSHCHLPYITSSFKLYTIIYTYNSIITPTLFIQLLLRWIVHFFKLCNSGQQVFILLYNYTLCSLTQYHGTPTQECTAKFPTSGSTGTVAEYKHTTVPSSMLALEVKQYRCTQSVLALKQWEAHTTNSHQM